MKFHWDKGLIWIELKLEYDGHKYTIPNCIIDTGSATTAIEIDLINFNYHLTTQIKRLSGIGGTQEVVSQNIKAIELNNSILNNLDIEFGDLQNSYGINGFIGTDILSQFKVNIDFVNQEINFIA